MFTDSFHVQSSHLIHSYSIGLMVTNHVLCMPSSAQEIESTLQLFDLTSFGSHAFNAASEGTIDPQ